MYRILLSAVITLGLIGCGGSSGKPATRHGGETPEPSILSQLGLSPSSASLAKPTDGLALLRPPAS